MKPVLAAIATIALAPALAWAQGSEAAYASLDTVLTRHVRDGVVDYGAIARDRGPLDRFLAASRAARPDAWPREARLAFWVNVYNARVIEGVVRRPGLKSVLDVGRTIGIPTLGFFRERAVSAGRKLSLNDIEHEILRKGFGEPRVHFVLNCASASCPVLPPRALRAATLDSALTAATQQFLADPTKNHIPPGASLELSAIFKWYREDFSGVPGELRGFVQRHRPAGPALRGDERIEFLDYDWSLNGHW